MTVRMPKSPMVHEELVWRREERVRRPALQPPERRREEATKTQEEGKGRQRKGPEMTDTFLTVCRYFPDHIWVFLVINHSVTDHGNLVVHLLYAFY